MKIMNKGKSAEILLYEDIGGWFGISADQFVKEVKAAGDVSSIDLRINSNGGNVFDGIAIYNYLKTHKATVNVHIDGLAASIASIIAMAGDTINIADNGWMMIHDPWVMTAGTAGELRKAADTMDGVRDTLLDTYMKRAKGKRDEVAAMMASETWLNANDAKKHGFADNVTGAMKLAASARSDWFRNIPQALKSPPQANETIARMEQALRRRGISAAA